MITICKFICATILEGGCYSYVTDGKTEAWRGFKPRNQTLAVSRYGFFTQQNTLETGLSLEVRLSVSPLNCQLLEISVFCSTGAQKTFIP